MLQKMSKKIAVAITTLGVWSYIGFNFLEGLVRWQAIEHGRMRKISSWLMDFEEEWAKNIASQVLVLFPSPAAYVAWSAGFDLLN